MLKKTYATVLTWFTSEACKKSPFSSRLCERSPKKFFADQQAVFKRGSQLTSSSKEYTKKRNTVLVCQPFPVKCTKLLLFKHSLAFVRCHWRGSLGPCDLDHATIARLAAAIRSLTSSIGRYIEIFRLQETLYRHHKAHMCTKGIHVAVQIWMLY